MKILAASTSTVFGSDYLAYIEEDICSFFGDNKRILFIPFARPGGISYEAYTAKAFSVFNRLGFELRGAHRFSNAEDGVAWADGFFTGGGNTFCLLKTLYETGYFEHIHAAVLDGKPYMGTSAGTNITGMTIGTTNDMPIVYPPSFQAFGWFPFNFNPHYLDPIEGSKHMGETREDRIREFHVQNAQTVVGLREGSWIMYEDNQISLKGNLSARIFRQNTEAIEMMPGALNL